MARSKMDGGASALSCGCLALLFWLYVAAVLGWWLFGEMLG